MGFKSAESLYIVLGCHRPVLSACSAAFSRAAFLDEPIPEKAGQPFTGAEEVRMVRMMAECVPMIVAIQVVWC